MYSTYYGLKLTQSLKGKTMPPPEVRRQNIIFKLLNKSEEIILGYSVLAIALLTVSQVFTRTFFKFGYGWLEQVGGHTLVMITLIGASLGVKHDKHFKMNAMIENIPAKYKRIIGIVSNLICSLFFIFIVFYGTVQTITLFQFGTKTSALGLPFFIVYIPIPLFSLVIFIRYAIAAFDLLYEKKEDSLL
jgi:C4-dicarboxylate transporter, DctQ subunit